MTPIQPAFYDPTKTYADNFSNGPSLLSQNIQPKSRAITKKQTFLGFEVNTPFGIPAGPLLNSQYVHEAFRFGFDVNVYKTQRSVSFHVNDFPNVLYLDIDGDLTLEKAQQPLVGRKDPPNNSQRFSITNSFGNPSKGPGFWQEDLKKALTYQGEGQLLIMSVVGTIQPGFSEEDYHNDFAKTAELANETGVKVIEVNLSCPNVANEGVICFNPDADASICKKVKEKIGDTPLIIKLGYFSHEQEALLENVLRKIGPYIAGISAINTIPAPVVDEQGKQALPGPNRLKSGICGAGIKWAGLDMVTRLSQLRDRLHQDFAIVGVGGAMNVADYEEYHKAGADLVQSATGAMWNPYLGFEVWEEESKS
jgi:dihydroorotate dehydrogenase